MNILENLRNAHTVINRSHSKVAYEQLIRKQMSQELTHEFGQTTSARQLEQFFSDSRIRNCVQIIDNFWPTLVSKMDIEADTEVKQSRSSITPRQKVANTFSAVDFFYDKKNFNRQFQTIAKSSLEQGFLTQWQSSPNTHISKDIQVPDLKIEFRVNSVLDDQNTSVPTITLRLALDMDELKYDFAFTFYNPEELVEVMARLNELIEAYKRIDKQFFYIFFFPTIKSIHKSFIEKNNLT